MGYYDIDDLDHDPELAKALGNMVVAWAYAESHLCQTLASILNVAVNSVLAAYYRIPTFEARIRFIQALIVEWDPGETDKPAIEAEIIGLSNLAQTRNQLVHNLWCTNDDKSETVIFNFRSPEDKGRRKRVKVNEVRQHVEAVRKRAHALNVLMPDLKL